MPFEITALKAVEESTFVLTASFIDENDLPVTPNAGLVYTLTDEAGNIINDLENMPLTPDTNVDILLFGDDLSIGYAKKAKLIILVEGSYDSTLGNNLPLKDSCTFTVEGLLKIT
jgi:hypothetical protein